MFELGLTTFYFQVWHEYYKPLAFRDTWTAFPTLLRPKSKGLIKLRSKNPRDYPLFYHNYLTDPDDVARLVEGQQNIYHRKFYKSNNESVKLIRFGFVNFFSVRKLIIDFRIWFMIICFNIVIYDSLF